MRNTLMLTEGEISSTVAEKNIQFMELNPGEKSNSYQTPD
jgi:hypothetical protein